MKLRIIKFAAFNQGQDIKANIKGGWYAGVTAILIGHYLATRRAKQMKQLRRL